MIEHEYDAVGLDFKSYEKLRICFPLWQVINRDLISYRKNLQMTFDLRLPSFNYFIHILVIAHLIRKSLQTLCDIIELMRWIFERAIVYNAGLVIQKGTH